MDRFSSQNAFDHAAFMRRFFAVDGLDAYPPKIWSDSVTSLITSLSNTESELLRDLICDRIGSRPTDRAMFAALERTIRSAPEFDAIEASLSTFEEAYFCRYSDGVCGDCGASEELAGALCAARLPVAENSATPAKKAAPEKKTSKQEAPAAQKPAASDPYLDFFKIPFEPGEINGLEYDALIDSDPVIVWRAGCELEPDFVQDILGEAEAAGVSRVFLIAQTELGPESLPINPKVALILLPIPPASGSLLSNVIETNAAFS